jgi:nitrile hydratase accessory protein
MTDDALLRSTLPGMPMDVDGPVFNAPWQAQAFAMTLALHESGAFTWPEWATALAAAIRRAQDDGDPDTGATYYHHWLDALETLVLSKGLGDGAQLHALEQAWAGAALRTPHGEAITLTADERRSAGRAAGRLTDGVAD